MIFTADLTIAAGIKTSVSLNPIMIDGTGMCGGCRVSVYDEIKFACVDGPEFDASGVNWEEFLARLDTYKNFELQAKDSHKCKLEKS